SIPCIVIRGISDAREGKNPELDKIHQPVAAAHAAAFAYELLDLWGQNKPAPPIRQTTAVSNPTPTPTSPIVVQQAAQDAKNVTLVLNFAGDPKDFPPEKQQEIVNALKEITGNADLKIVGSEGGSFHLLLKCSETDQAKLVSPETSGALRQR